MCSRAPRLPVAGLIPRALHDASSPNRHLLLNPRIRRDLDPSPAALATIEG
jgi:hypothetical protein